MPIKIKTGILLIEDDKVLLIKETSESCATPRWNFIKGTYEEENDADIFAAAIRECKEEVCVRAELTAALGCYFSKEGSKIRVQFNFLARIEEGVPALPDKMDQALHDENITQIRWFSRAELSALRPEEFISNRTFAALQDYLRSVNYPLTIVRTVRM